jgi:hypothetical protein
MAFLYGQSGDELADPCPFEQRQGVGLGAGQVCVR